MEYSSNICLLMFTYAVCREALGDVAGGAAEGHIDRGGVTLQERGVLHFIQRPALSRPLLSQP